MKKALKMLLVSVLAATLFTSVALAEVTIGGWGRVLFTPAGTEGKEISPDRGVSWGGGQRIGFTVAGNSDNVGFQVDLKADDGDISVNDQQKVWVKPMDMIKLEVGTVIFYDRYRGNAGFGSWNWLRPGATANMNGGADEDLTFRRMSINDGAVLEISPMPALGIFAGWGDNYYEYVNANIGVSGYYKDNDTDSNGDGTLDSGGEPLTTAQMLALGQYGVGYDIAGVGTVRAQIIGRRNKTADADYYVVNAAVKIDKIMPALYADLGVFYCTDDDNKLSQWYSHHENNKVAAYVKYAMAPMTIHFLADIILDQDVTDGNKKDQMAMQIGLGLDYDLGNGMGITSDVRYADKNYVNNADGKDGEVAVMAGVEQGFSNGKFGAAFQYSTYKLARYEVKEKADSGQWAIPIKVEYWF